MFMCHIENNYATNCQNYIMYVAVIEILPIWGQTVLGNFLKMWKIFGNFENFPEIQEKFPKI